MNHNLQTPTLAPASPDWIGMLYKADKRLGRTDTITLLAFYNQVNPVEHHFSHEFTDGFGALSKLLLAAGVSDFKTPTRAQEQWGLHQVANGVKKFVNDLKPSHAQFRASVYAPSSAAVAAGDVPLKNEAFFVLDKNSSQLFFEKIKRERMNVTSTVLHFCHVVVRDVLISADAGSNNAAEKWLLPLNMRDASEVTCMQNRSTGIGIDLSGCESLAHTQTKYASSLNLIAARLTYWASHIGCVVGEENVYRLAKLRGSRNSWMGTFSNLGRFDFTHLANKPESLIPSALALLPPAGSPCFPIGFGLMTWNGCLSLGMRVHPSLSAEVVNSQDMLQNILGKLSDFCGGELTCRNSLDLH